MLWSKRYHWHKTSEKIYEVQDIRNVSTRMTCKVYVTWKACKFSRIYKTCKTFRIYKTFRNFSVSSVARLSKVSGHRVLQKTFSSFRASGLQNIGDFQFKVASLTRLSRLSRFPKPSSVFKMIRIPTISNRSGIVSKLRIEVYASFNIYARNLQGDTAQNVQANDTS